MARNLARHSAAQFAAIFAAQFSGAHFSDARLRPRVQALILARILGLPLEMENVKVEPLYPASMAELPVPEFMAQLPTLDDEFAAKVAAAEAEGKVLRYAASVDVASQSLTVGLLAVPKDSALGSLQGSDNLVEVYTTWYADSPLVLRGAGAGTGTTAAGVLSDMIDLAYTRD